MSNVNSLHLDINLRFLYGCFDKGHKSIEKLDVLCNFFVGDRVAKYQYIQIFPFQGGHHGEQFFFLHMEYKIRKECYLCVGGSNVGKKSIEHS